MSVQFQRRHYGVTISQDIKIHKRHRTVSEKRELQQKGCNFCFFPCFLWFFSLFWGLMVFIGICSVLICMVFVAFGVWIPQARDILNTRDDENGHEMS